MLDGYSSLCDDFYIDMYINTKLELPTQRDTILVFFERIQKQFPSMGYFYRGENDEYYLEEERDTGHYRWVALESDRIGSGITNPSSFQDAYNQDIMVLEFVPHMLGISHLDIDPLDVSFAMDFECAGNHDEVIAEALFGSTAFGCLLDLPAAKPIVFSPGVVVAFSEDNRTQVRISVESRTSIFHPGKKRQNPGQPISLSVTIRQYPQIPRKFDAVESFKNQCALAQDLMDEKIVPNFVHPLYNVIAQKRLT